MDLGPIVIKCNPEAPIDENLRKYLIEHFKPFEEAEATLTTDEILNELFKAYGVYGQKITEMGLVDAEEEMTMEELAKKIAPYNAAAINAVVANAGKATLLLRLLKEKVDGILAQLDANPMAVLMNEGLKGLQLGCKLIAEKIEL